MIGAGVRLLIRKARLGKPRRRKLRADRPRKASALRSNQRPNCTSHKNRQTRFSSGLSTV
ncbi:hypothetical protein KEH51_28755 [[Brevibacterium] frigoritolerans]|uniref:Uncharacterized protein n=1 Tax=Peribacillus frigoritolerans TaxID=450367 RepID=A0A941FLF5_9BACI|nr:hypothetical protein [Peribacillus frigoritolerans]